MSPNPRFLRVAAVAAGLTALTTLAIHLLPGLWAGSQSFEAQLALRTNLIYMARLWIVLIHCLLVVISMFAVRTLAPPDSRSLASLGFLAFLVFAYTEALRTSLGIFALNRTWRATYATATDAGARERARALIEGFPGVTEALFFIFIAAFLLGTLCYGLAFCRAGGLTGRVGWLFLIWAALSVPGLVDTCLGRDFLAPYFGWVGPGFQAPARAVIAVWLWRAGSSSTAI